MINNNIFVKKNNNNCNKLFFVISKKIKLYFFKLIIFKKYFDNYNFFYNFQKLKNIYFNIFFFKLNFIVLNKNYLNSIKIKKHKKIKNFFMFFNKLKIKKIKTKKLIYFFLNQTSPNYYNVSKKNYSIQLNFKKIKKTLYIQFFRKIFIKFIKKTNYKIYLDTNNLFNNINNKNIFQNYFNSRSYIIFNKNIIFFFFLKNKVNYFLKNYFFKKLNTTRNFFILETKNICVHFKNLSKNLLMFTDFFNYNFFQLNFNFVSNKYLMGFFNYFYNKISNSSYQSNFKVFSNYYPIVLSNSNNKQDRSFFNKFKQNRNIDFINLTNKLFIPFLENLLQKKIFIKIDSNNFNKISNFYFTKILNEYKNFQPQYFKNFLTTDFIEIIWYSFLLKDLKMLSDWVSKLMENLNFKNHKKFLNFFQNFINKYSNFFIDVLSVKGFFFDIRGKVGVTGSSKKRHYFFKFGSLKKSSKSIKINFNQNLVRTYSGVLGLTYIISY